MKEPTVEIAPKEPLPFRWRYIALPVALLFFSIIITACFYRLLPGEVAYHFKEGSPDKWMSRGAIIAWTLAPQLILTLIATGIVWLMIKISTRFAQIDVSRAKRLLSIMGNMVALPQIILGFAMVDIFSYNSYQVHLLPLWLFALIVMGSGGIVLAILFILVIRHALKAGQTLPGRTFKEQQ